MVSIVVGPVLLISHSFAAEMRSQERQSNDEKDNDANAYARDGAWRKAAAGV